MMNNFSNTDRRFRITVATPGMSGNLRQSSLTYEVSFANLSQTIQNIHRLGGKIVSITEMALEM
ncbi:phycoerythrin-associated linker protein CpeE [Stanieria sp. NIES-3757]|nr:phycoerythrin-associated linker protein CpeE [Stanieria sp. NIES-3757]